MTSRAEMSALTLPFGPMVHEAVPRSSLPSRAPSTKRSSFPVISPLIRIPCEMHAAARGETGSGDPTAGAVALLGVLDWGMAAPGGMAASAGPWGFVSSFLHIRHLDTQFGFSKSPVVEREGGATSETSR